LVLIDCSHRIIAQAIGVIRVVAVANETTLFVVILVQTAIPGANPKRTALVYEQRPGITLTQAVRIARVGTVDLEAGTIISVQPIRCGKPHKAQIVLGNVPDQVI
jgi:hypothetical protein